MRSILETTDPVLVSYVEALLKEAGIGLHVADVNMSIVEGSIGIFPRRVLVGDDDAERARRILADAGLAQWLAGSNRRTETAGAVAATPPQADATAHEATTDAFLGGRLSIRQPRKGYRAGLDAVLLAAAAPVRAGTGERVLDAGSGVGVVGLSVAERISDALVTLVELEPELLALARENVGDNGLSDRVSVVQADVAAGGAAFNGSGSELTPGTFAHVLANPPYFAAGSGTEPSDNLKAGAHQMPREGLDAWVRFLATAAAADGSATIIHRADALPAVLAALDGRFGAIKVFPVFPRAGEAASRVIVQGIKGSRAPLTLLAGLVLHMEGHGFAPEAEAILRHGAALDLEP